MKLVKCPRCDLNYIREDDKYCKVCLREMKGEPTNDDMELCSVCNAAPALPGKDVCLFCYKEMSGEENNDDTESENIPVSGEAALDIDPISTMDEIIPDTEEDPDGAMSLEALGEEEDEDEDDNDFDDEENIGKPRKGKK